MGLNPIADMSGWSHSGGEESWLCRLGWLYKKRLQEKAVCLQHMSAMGLRPSALAWMLKPPQATEQAFFSFHCEGAPSLTSVGGTRKGYHIRRPWVQSPVCPFLQKNTFRGAQPSAQSYREAGDLSMELRRAAALISPVRL